VNEAPRLLVSVRNPDEASAALRGGADWIDLKEPQRGPLGAVDAATARHVVERVAGRSPLSAAAGELNQWRNPTSRGAYPPGPDAEQKLTEVPGISLLKLGLSACRDTDWQSPLQIAQREMAAADKQLVAVIYADHATAQSPRPQAIVDFAAEAECPWVLIDTFDKQAGALMDHFSAQQLQTLLQSINASGRRAVVAGSLNLDVIANLPLDLIDMVAVRGAACEGGRNGTICEQRVAALRELLTAC
jgi:(5-formylfuran-3-yl)methyl phosphate synthase